MSTSGRLVFCTAYGDLLQEKITAKPVNAACAVCGTINLVRSRDSANIPSPLEKLPWVGFDPNHGIESVPVPPDTTSTSKPGTFPSVLQRKKHSNVQEMKPNEYPPELTIEQVCSECGAKEMWYSTKQLRGADEGSTIFFECPLCGHN